MSLDFRIVRITFEDDGFTDVFENEAIVAQGQRTGSWVQNQATITIANIDKETRDRLATRYRPQDQLRVGQTRGFCFVDVGRDSYGTFRLFEGNIVLVDVTDPPDISLVVTVVANYFSKSDLASKNFGFTNKLSGIAASIAKDLEVELDFQVTNDFNIQNLTYSGDLAGQMKIFDDIPYIDGFIDNGKLIVKDRYSAIDSNIIHIDADNEMIGIPRFTDVGLSVRVLAKASIRPGSIISIFSRIYPATNGEYVVVNIEFDVANRDTQFYFDIFATRRVQ